MSNMKKIPSLIYGTAWKKERTAELVEKAILNGFEGIDTACQPKHYDEAGVGHALQNLKKKGVDTSALFIQTKFTPLDGQDPNKLPYAQAASLVEQIQQSFQASLQNLQVKTISSLLLHSPLYPLEETFKAWRELEIFHDDEKVKALGISNCYSLEEFTWIYKQAKVKPKILQNRFYSDTGYDHELRGFCEQNHVTYQAFWTLTANPHLLKHPIVKQLATHYQVTEAQIFYRFLTQMNIVPLIGTCSERHMKEDLSIFNFTLLDSDREEIEKLIRAQQPHTAE